MEEQLNIRYTLTKDDVYYLINMYDGQFRSFVALKMITDFDNDQDVLTWFNKRVDEHLRPVAPVLIAERIIPIEL